MERNKYPLKLRSVNKEIIWGGEKLARHYGKGEGSIAEAWELTVHPEGVNVIENGEYAGMTLAEYLGSDEFPIMIKLIDAADRLSVQVHPQKTEMWYVLEAEEGASLVCGLKGKFDREAFEGALKEKRVSELLRYVPVKRGDVFFIPQGLVHAIGGGITVAEIQENSNVTYRIYDYDRVKDGKPRPLHIEEAMTTVKDFEESDIDALRYEGGDRSSVCDCRSFKVEKYSLDGELALAASDSFLSVICLEGGGRLGSEELFKGDSFFIPEGCEALVKGKCEIIVTRAR